MQELRLVAVSEDGSYLVLATAGRGTRFTLPVDDRLRAAIRGHFSRLGQFEIEVESPLRPKEIQARIRAGETAEEIADSAGIPVERVRWFEGPVLQEREYMAQQAQRCVMRTPGESTPGPPLGELVEERLGHRGADLEEVTWDAWKCEDNSWQVRLSFYDGGRPHAAEWKFDPRRRVVRALDDEAVRLSSLTAEEPPPLADTVTPLRRPAMKIVSDQRRDYPAGRPFAPLSQPVPPAATPLNPEPFTPERFQREARAADFPDLEALSALLDGEPTVLPPPPGRDPGEAPSAHPSAVSLTPPAPQEPARAPSAERPADTGAAGSAPQHTPAADASASERPAEDERETLDPRPAVSPVSAPSPAAEAATADSRPSAPAAQAPAEPSGEPVPAASAAPNATAAETDPALSEDAPAPATSVGESAGPAAEAAAATSDPVSEQQPARSAPERPADRQESAPAAPEQPARAAEPPAAAHPVHPDVAPKPAAPVDRPAPPPAEQPAVAQQPTVPEPRREPPKPKPAPKPAPVPAAAAAAPAKAEPRPRKRPARNRRASVPSWDEIMFGARRPD
ncbi:septation protein SepH [Actinocorallia sp. B10E7]|uniref:septation protein SepH n=1 Tax=Actinocorallia sp. B10E7 TaxID=3153558 RepID=UPI00325F2E27